MSKELRLALVVLLVAVFAFGSAASVAWASSSQASTTPDPEPVEEEVEKDRSEGTVGDSGGCLRLNTGVNNATICNPGENKEFKAWPISQDELKTMGQEVKFSGFGLYVESEFQAPAFVCFPKPASGDAKIFRYIPAFNLWSLVAPQAENEDGDICADGSTNVTYALIFPPSVGE